MILEHRPEPFTEVEGRSPHVQSSPKDGSPRSVHTIGEPATDAVISLRRLG